jgi:hypothetical protein
MFVVVAVTATEVLPMYPPVFKVKTRLPEAAVAVTVAVTVTLWSITSVGTKLLGSEGLFVNVTVAPDANPDTALLVNATG